MGIVYRGKENRMKARLLPACSSHLRELIIIALLLVFSERSNAGGKFGIYGIRMVPYGTDAKQFGEGTVRIHPQYFQIYLGVGIAFEMIHNL